MHLFGNEMKKPVTHKFSVKQYEKLLFYSMKYWKNGEALEWGNYNKQFLRMSTF